MSSLLIKVLLLLNFYVFYVSKIYFALGYKIKNVCYYSKK